MVPGRVGWRSQDGGVCWGLGGYSARRLGWCLSRQATAGGAARFCGVQGQWRACGGCWRPSLRSCRVGASKGLGAGGRSGALAVLVSCGHSVTFSSWGRGSVGGGRWGHVPSCYDIEGLDRLWYTGAGHGVFSRWCAVGWGECWGVRLVAGHHVHSVKLELGDQAGPLSCGCHPARGGPRCGWPRIRYRARCSQQTADSGTVFPCYVATWWRV